MKKVFAILVMTVFILMMFVSVQAEEPVVDPVLESVIEEETVEPPANEQQEPPAENAEQEEPATIAQTALDFFQEHAGEVFSSLSFVGALVLAWCYKKGLLPILSASISKLSKTLHDGVDGASSVALKTSETLSGFMDKVSPVLEKMDGFSSVIDRMDAEMTATKKDRDLLACALKSQSDMFYNLFMASNLPQYQKEAVGAEHKKMESLIAELSGDGANEDK